MEPKGFEFKVMIGLDSQTVKEASFNLL
ncbi:hypothetical protein PSYAE_27318 [Pseudomonas amygdali pv. aesculi str. 0893_23]|nr:hypothetical protein PSYAE_27318 [Pseudomonas amygdali pv. aesculi str. 0893_23]